MSEKWEKLATPPAWALKPIKGGRLKGKTDISPQWRYKVMTEVYGPCGKGWKYEIVRLWIDVGPQDQVFVSAQVNLYVKWKDSWSEPIPGVGGNLLVEKESSGLHANDEAYKMALTDALSVAMKMLGVGSTVYEGRMDGSKYFKPERPSATPAATATAPKKKELTDWQKKLLESLTETCDGDKEEMKTMLHSLTEWEKVIKAEDGTEKKELMPGKTSLYDCSDKMCQVAYGKLKALREAL